eukprot:Hpha_TRINITY_DN22267_c0_g1::TRINITY_DN22267_c0_g1_i1::g.167174::m.167174
MLHEKRRSIGDLKLRVGGLGDSPAVEEPVAAQTPPQPRSALARSNRGRAASPQRPSSRTSHPGSMGPSSFGSPLPASAIRGHVIVVTPKSESFDGLHRAVSCQQDVRRPAPLAPIPMPSGGARMFIKAPGMGLRGVSRPKLAVQMEEHIERELRLLEASHGESNQGEGSDRGYQRLNVFREAFRMFTNATKTYAPVLERILQEYEDFIRYLETLIESAGKDRRQLWKEFEVRQQLREAEIAEEAAAQRRSMYKQEEELRSRRQDVEDQIDHIQTELHEYQKELGRMHDQNLTLAGQLVDYRERAAIADKALHDAHVRLREKEQKEREHLAALDRERGGGGGGEGNSKPPRGVQSLKSSEYLHKINTHDDDP